MQILVIAILLKVAVITRGDGFYPGYTPTSNNDPYTRFYYTSSPKQYSSGYTPESDQYSSPSTSSITYNLPQSDQDSSQGYAIPYNSAKTYSNSYQHDTDYSHLASQATSQISPYSNSLEENYQSAADYPNYSHSDDYSSVRNHENHHQPLSYETSQNSLPSPGSYYREHENSNIEVSSHNSNIEIPSNTNYQPLPQTTIHVNPEPVPLSQHIQITKHVPIPIYKQIHIPVLKPVKVEIPHPMIVPVPKPFPVQIPISQPVVVPIVKEIAIPVEKIVPFPVEKRIPYTVEKHVPYKVEKHVSVYVPQPYPLKIPIIKTVVHKFKTYKRGFLHGWN